jgi:hypothetical protein
MVMGHVDHRGLELLVQFGDFEAHVDPQSGVEVGERFVEEEGFGFAHDGAADGDALTLATRQRARPAVEIARQVQRAGRVVDLLVDDGLRCLGHLEREGDVVAHAHMGVKRVGLEDHGQAPARGRRGGDVLAIELDMARGRVLEPGDQPQQG